MAPRNRYKMATAPEILLEEALDIAEFIVRKIDDRDPKFVTILDRKHQIESALHTTRDADEYLGGYLPLLRGNLQCPNCWVRDGIHAGLFPIHGADEKGCFICTMCGYEVAISD